MTCVLRIAGADLDVGSLTKALPLVPDGVYRKGEPRLQRSTGTGAINQSSGVGYVVSEAGLEEFDLQVEDAIRFLTTNASALAILSEFPGVEVAVLDFGLEWRDVTVQTDHLPPRLLRLVGSLDLGIELTHYPISHELQDGPA